MLGAALSAGDKDKQDLDSAFLHGTYRLQSKPTRTTNTHRLSFTFALRPSNSSARNLDMPPGTPFVLSPPPSLFLGHLPFPPPPNSYYDIQSLVPRLAVCLLWVFLPSLEPLANTFSVTNAWKPLNSYLAYWFLLLRAAGHSGNANSLCAKLMTLELLGFEFTSYVSPTPPRWIPYVFPCFVLGFFWIPMSF